MQGLKKSAGLILALVLLVVAIGWTGGRYYTAKGANLIEEKPKEARSYFETASTFNPFCGKPYAWKARTFYNHDDLEIAAHKGKVSVPQKVIDNYQKSVDKYSTPSWAYKNLGEIYYNYGIYYKLFQDKPDKAKRYAKESISLLKRTLNSTSDSWSYSMIGHLNNFVLDQHETAKTYFNRAKKIDPQNPIPYHGLGYTYKNIGEFDKALEQFNKSIEIQPTPEAYLGKAASLNESQGYVLVGVNSYRKALELDPSNIIALKNLTFAFLEIEEKIPAQSYLERLKKADEHNIYEAEIEKFDNRVKELK